MRRSLVTPCGRTVAWIALAILLAGGPAAALTDEEIFRDFRFDFIHPGARALGMGGAFVAVADDATAAAANPAGLHLLPGAQAFAELRVLDPDPSSRESRTGSLAVDTQTGARNLPFLGLDAVSEADTLTEPSFVAFAWPFELGWGRRLTVAGSRQVVFSRERAVDGTRARFSFDTFPNTVQGGQVVAYSVATPVSGSSDIDIVFWNASAALEVHEDFSVGVTVALAELDVQAETLTRVIDPLQLFVDPTNPRSVGRPDTDVFRTAIDDSDTDVAFTIGLHWHPDSAFAEGPSPWRFGAVYRGGAAFAVEETTSVNGNLDDRFDNTFVVPDRFGVGVSYELEQGWLITGELERVEYTDMLDGFRPGVNFLTSDRIAGGAFATSPSRDIEFSVDDGTVFRLGAEYSRPFAGASGARFAVRGGWFRSPDSSLEMTRFSGADPDINKTFQKAFPGGEDQDHFTAGVGFTFGRSSLHIAGETSDLGSQFVASYAFSLGRGEAGEDRP